MSTTAYPTGWQAAARQTSWWLVVAVWTLSLLTPYPVRAGQATLTPEAGFSLSKTLHVLAYAGLTAALPWFGPRGGRRWWLVAFLALHAGATEFFQQWVPERTGSLRDVALDHLGIALGLACTWRVWRGR
jgi:VanZ family protein